MLYIFVNIYRCHNIKVIDHFMTACASASNILNAKWQIDRPIKLQRIHNSLILFLKSVVKQENIYTLSKDTLDPFCSLTFTRYLWMHVPQGSSHVHLKVWNISKTLRLKQPSSFLGFNTPLKIKKILRGFCIPINPYDNVVWMKMMSGFPIIELSKSSLKIAFVPAIFTS